jgi:L-alanine-DL-glutamate epimerase-like enolase superfamily enzyme
MPEAEVGQERPNALEGRAPLTWEGVTLQLRTTFRLASSTSDQRHNVIVHLAEGLGEAAAVPQFNDTQAGLMADLARAAEGLADDPFRIEDLLNGLPPVSQAARAAVDIALHDLLGKRLGQPLYRVLGLDPRRLPPTSFTIAIDEPALMAERARQSGYPILKIKLGSADDEAIVRAIRRVTPARLRADVNGGWTRDQAARIIPRLARYELEFIEQPLAAGDLDGLRWLRSQNLGVPIFADESVMTARDVARHAGLVDGVVIKLMKAGGIREALRAIAVARAHDMRVMLSCMIETSIGVTAAAHLAPLCDYADLDGPLLISNDPYTGLCYRGAQLALPEAPGIGVTGRTQ